MQLFNASIAEDIAAGSSVTTLTATDLDSGEFSRLVYSISAVQGPPLDQLNGTFVIDAYSGVVSTVGSFDREVFEGPYIITVSYV